MMDSVIIAAPLLIAAIVMAVRFVGCSFAPIGTRPIRRTAARYWNTPGLVSFWHLDDRRAPRPWTARTGTTGRIRAG